MITGERGGISEGDEQALRDAGLAHVLAIAGLHMALVGLGLFWLVRAGLAAWPRVALHYPIKKWAAGAALGGALFYLVVSGAAAPTIRAFTMLAMMLLAILVDRPALSMRAVALAATILLLLRAGEPDRAGIPDVVFGGRQPDRRRGMGAGRALARPPVGPRRFAAVRRYLRGIVTTSLVGSIATMPYAAFHFDRATHYAVLGNLLAMPVMGFVTMPAAAFAVVLMPFGLDAWPLHVMGWGIDAMLAVGRFVSRLPGAVSVVSAWPVSALVADLPWWTVVVIWRRRWRWLGLVAIVAGIVQALAAPGADILMAATRKPLLIAAATGCCISSGRRATNIRLSEWLKRDGDERTADVAVAAPADGVHCDGEGCVTRLPDGETLRDTAPVRGAGRGLRPRRHRRQCRARTRHLSGTEACCRLERYRCECRRLGQARVPAVGRDCHGRARRAAVESRPERPSSDG